MTTNAVEHLLGFTLETSVDDFPVEVVDSAKVFIFDTLAVGVAGNYGVSAKQLLQAAQTWGKGEEASVLGSDLKLPAPSAAFINGYRIHCLEWDCVHEEAVLHPMSVLMAALLAYAERRNELSSEELIEATVLGVDLAVNVGLSAKGKLRFFRPANAGLFAAAAILARLQGFDLKQTQDVWGLAYSQMAGTMQAHIEGSIALPLQIGLSARAALTAVDLVAHGLTGPHDILEGPYGYYNLFEAGGDCSRVLSSLGKEWRMNEVSHKPFPTGRAAHGALDGLQRIQAEHDIPVDEIERISIHTPVLIERLVGRPYQTGMTANYARLCLPYLASVLLHEGSVGPTSCTEKLLSNEKIKSLAQRIKVHADEEFGQEDMTPQRIIVSTQSGQEFEWLVEHTLGSPDNPLDKRAQFSKAEICFRAAFAKSVTERVNSLHSLIFNLEHGHNIIKPLISICETSEHKL